MYSVPISISAWTVVVAVASLVKLVSAVPLASTDQACRDIKAALPGKLFYAQDRQYGLENTDYYNIGLAALMPACIVQPTTAQEVSAVVKILNKYADVPFAIKSGGHDPNEGHSSVKGGVLIALSQMKGAVYDKKKNIARFKPGGHWNDVLGKLDKEGIAVVGGRLGIVGVGGLVMQGGLSFLSAQYGLAADNILEYEMVLANGTIANINSQNHKELVTAMRGGGDQFGIATEFTAKAHKMGQVWGGLRLFTGGSKAVLYEGLHDFVNNPTDPKSAVIFTHAQPLGLMSIYMLFYFYDGPNPPKGAWGKLSDVRPALDLCKTRSYPDMLDAATIGGTTDNAASTDLLGGLASLGSLFGGSSSANGGIAAKGSESLLAGLFGGKGKSAMTTLMERAAAIVMADPVPSNATTLPRSMAMGQRTLFRSLTLPLLDNEWFSEIEKIWTDTTGSFAFRHPTASGTIALQPLPNIIGKHSEANGGNAMGLKGTDPPRFVIEIAWLWSDKTLDAEIEALSKKFGDAVQAKAQSQLARSVSSGTYFPLFMNDAHKDQDVFESYENKAKFALLQKSVDPNGFWKRTGSFKHA